jgi:hypothetical protein
MASGLDREQELDLLPSLRLGTAEIPPPPVSGHVDEGRGTAMFPARQGLRTGSLIFGPAALITDPFATAANNKLLVGYWPPSDGDGLIATISIVAKDGAKVALWREFIPPERPLPSTYRTRLLPLPSSVNRKVRLLIELSPGPSGNAEADWLFLGHLTVYGAS